MFQEHFSKLFYRVRNNLVFVLQIVSISVNVFIYTKLFE